LAHFLDSAAIVAIRNELPAKQALLFISQSCSKKRLKRVKTLKKQA